MNPLIRQFFIKSELDVQHQDDNLQRFAELIIQECSGVCEIYADRLIGNTEKGEASRDTAYMLADNIKTHFGVQQ